MNLAALSIKRPVFISSLVIVMLAVGLLSLMRLSIDLFPNVTLPIVMVMTPYPGAGPQEIETLISKPMEDEFSGLSGMKSLTSINREGVSILVAEFTIETDIKFAEQQIRDRLGSVKHKLPDDIKEPIIRRMDPADQPVLILAVTAKDLSPAKLYDFANDDLRPKISQLKNVGLVEPIGGRKREIHVDLDPEKLKGAGLSVSVVAARIGATGVNIPAGVLEKGEKELTFRTLGEFSNIQDIRDIVVNFFGNENIVTVSKLGQVVDSLQDEKSRVYYNGEPALFLMVYRQTGSNTVAVSAAVKDEIKKINEDFAKQGINAKITIVRDGAKMIRASVDDVYESIFIGVILTIIVVYFFLGSGRSTIITGLALPNSLLGSFILMAVAGFTINSLTLLALSLAVGLLIDDAIVVRENIFRHIETGKSPVDASLDGTREVTLAVIAASLTVIAVFGPIAFIQGVIGQFFKEFGLTVCFAMLISLFDALTMAPMLSAYFAGTSHGPSTKGVWGRTVGAAVRWFDRLQDKLEDMYEYTLHWTLRFPVTVIGIAFVLFIASLAITKFIPKTFLPENNMGEFRISIELPAGSSLDRTNEVAKEIESRLKKSPEVDSFVTLIGTRDGELNKANFFVMLVPAKQRSINTSQMKDRIRLQLKDMAYARPIVADIDMLAGGLRPFTLNIVGNDLDEIQKYADQLYEKLKKHPGLEDVDTSFRTGRPEFQVIPDNRRSQELGVLTSQIGFELRARTTGLTPVVFREDGREYDVRVRLMEPYRDVREQFHQAQVPNMNNKLIPLRNVASAKETIGPATILRKDRGRYVQLNADVAPGGPGLGSVMKDVDHILKDEIKLPPNLRYEYVGQAEGFKEMGVSLTIAALLGTLFIYLVLASLYESFINPLTIMLVLPLAVSGAFFFLLITRKSIDIFSMIGIIMLLGISTKNSILLVDFATQLIHSGVERNQALIQAGRTRLRPILMTSMALIAGMLPVAIGLNEVSSMRTSMGIAIIGGLVSSTLLTLVVVPAAYSYIDRFREWLTAIGVKIFLPKDDHNEAMLNLSRNASYDERDYTPPPPPRSRKRGH